MRALADPERIERLMVELGKVARAEGRVFLAGGATAVLEGWRETTVALDPAAFRNAVESLFGEPES